ncbi:Hsp70 family protein [bacterium]|nr:Hsp70 family protein [bacterium]
MSYIIGIDLGTTNSGVSVVESTEPVMIPNSEMKFVTPSVVGIIPETNTLIVGEKAKRQLLMYPECTAAEVKRIMGSDKKIKLGERSYTPQEISAMILQSLKKDAELYLNQPITEAVITVPAYFEDVRRQATKDAGTIAGLNVRRIINEPTSAALAYGIDRKRDQTIVVYDLGGGTFDVSIIEVNPGIMEVIATAGNPYLGGTDFDKMIIDWLLEQFKNDTGIDLSVDRVALQHLKYLAEEAKIRLSTDFRAIIEHPAIAKDGDKILNLRYELTRNRFEDMIRDMITETITLVDEVLNNADLSYREIDEVILIGGSTRMPIVRELVQSKMRKIPNYDVDPDHSVALGAGMQGGLIDGKIKSVILSDILSHSLGTETVGDVFDVLIPRHSFIPTSVTEDYTTVVENQSRVRVNVFEGESKTASKNNRLGTFVLDEIPQGPAGSQTVKVKFDIDNDGILTVVATNLETGKMNHITIEASKTRMSDEDIVRAKDHMDRMVEEEKIAPQKPVSESQELYREALALINKAESLLHEVDEFHVTLLATCIHELEFAIGKNDVDLVKEKEDELTELLYDIESEISG